jgi:hypothetical protein
MSDVIEVAKISLVYDKAINYAFQQNAIPVIKELKFCNDETARKNLRIKPNSFSMALGTKKRFLANAPFLPWGMSRVEANRTSNGPILASGRQ